MSIEPVLLRGIRARVGESAGRWIEQTAAQAADGTLNALLDAYTQASRWLGLTRLGLGPEDVSAAGAAADVCFDPWTVEDAGRLLLLLARNRAAPSSQAFADDAVACFEQSDAREQRSWVRGVALLPEPARFLPVVVDTCRTNILPLFEAVACENPYPAVHFPDLNFNQMVLKALFNGVALERIVGLPGRLNPELARMASDYAAERRAAGRVVPGDIGLVTVPGTEERTLR